ncbi:MAG: hydrogenase formation protein HypD [Prochlorotrichaceae cyanobacterium]|jgi:hydrogenase expression/formation protein HypD
MKFVDEYRDQVFAQQYIPTIASITTRPWTIMEICGGQTHTIVKYGLDTLIPPEITLIHGPGCPVCVTPAEIIDTAIVLAAHPEIIFCSFGDMLRVPGSRMLQSGDEQPGGSKPLDLLSIKASGGDVRMVYSPLDALKIAQTYPDRQVVFFAVGFETTAPATAMAVYQAANQGISNFSLLVSHVLVPPAMEAILSSPECRVQGFLAAGHVCTVMGYEQYKTIAPRYQVPIVVTGFEPLDVLQGIYLCIKQLEEGRSEVENQYTRSVRPQGNQPAQQLMQEVFEIVPQQWRGIGTIGNSGLGLREKYQAFDTCKRFAAYLATQSPSQPQPNDCLSGLILQGILKPQDCPAFGTQCTPENPLGAPMVSSEGACAAYYRYRQPLAS